MHSWKRILTLSVGLFLLVSSLGLAQQMERSQVPLKYQWNLADLYPTDDAWRAAKTKVEADINTLGDLKGTLGTSQSMLTTLDRISSVRKEFLRLYAYAQMHSDQDTRDAKYQAMSQEIQQLAATLDAKTAWVKPEILGMDASKVDGFLKAA